MNPMITNLVLMLVVNKFAGKLDFEDPFIVNVVRGCFIASNVIVFLVYFYVYHLVEKRNDLTTFTYEKPGSMFNPQETKEKITQTHKAYDLEQVLSAIKGQVPTLLMMGFMHLYKGYTNPLVLQSIMPLKGALEAPIVQMHLLGRTGAQFKRPFTPPAMFGNKEEPKEEPKIKEVAADAKADVKATEAKTSESKTTTKKRTSRRT